MSLLETIKEKIEDHFDRGKDRLEICKSCIQYVPSHDVCGTCLCYMPVKVNVPTAKCPYDKWVE